MFSGNKNNIFYKENRTGYERNGKFEIIIFIVEIFLTNCTFHVCISNIIVFFYTEKNRSIQSKGIKRRVMWNVIWNFWVSLRTVRRYHLHAANIHNYNPARKIKLTDDHRTNRVNFATRYLNFDWENEIVIFTDEKCFKSDMDGRKILWRWSRERGEVYHQQRVRSQNKQAINTR